MNKEENNKKTTNTLSEEELQDMIGKYDKESRFRKYKGILAKVVTLLAVTFSLFQLYTAIFGQLPSQLQRSVHLAFALGLIFLLFPINKKVKRNKLPWYDALFSFSGVAVGLYWVFQYEDLIYRAGMYTNVDLIMGLIAILLVLEASRRVVGIPITIIALVFLLYALFGEYMPSFFAHKGVTETRLVSHMYYTLDGILGTPLGVSSTFIFLFLLFSAFLERTGVGQYFNELALLIAGRSIGGPAKVAIFSSALQGTISGSSVANVVTSGSYTIPMMKKTGYRSEFAGAVEAAASTGGQLMPPIMGAAAFLMAEFTNISYWSIAIAAIIPAILYFAGIWIMVHFEAKRLGLKGLTKDELPNKKETLKKLYLLLPIFIIIGTLMMGYSAIRAALFGLLSVILVSAIKKETRLSFLDIIKSLETGARTALSVAAATACAGMIVGVVTLTGLGLKFANGLIELSGGVILLTLFFTMIASIILGMGSPTTANYIITSTIAAPAIITLLSEPGATEISPVVLLSAHMFTFYFGIVADITPPVALAAFAATGISGGNPIRTGLEASRLAIAAFLIPYVFVLAPDLLLINSDIVSVITISVTAFLGMIGLSSGLIGHWKIHLSWIERIIVIASGLLLIYPETYSDIIGLVILTVIFIIQSIKSKK